MSRAVELPLWLVALVVRLATISHINRLIDDQEMSPIAEQHAASGLPPSSPWQMRPRRPQAA